MLAFVAANDIQSFFYQPHVLAVTHTLTLGWISLAVIGVAYRFVPALTKRAVRWPWLGRLQVATFVVGELGLVAHFWIGHLGGMVWSAGVLVCSIVLLLTCLLPLVVHAPSYDATVIGIAVGLLSFLGVGTLGLLYTIDKVHPFLGGSVLSNIAAHAHLAALGWVSLMICAVSYRMVTAFILPAKTLPGPARAQILSLSLVVPMLVAALLWRSWLVWPLAFLVASTLLWYVSIILRLLRTRRMQLDWSMRHVQAAIAYLCAATVCGLAFVSGVDVGGRTGARLAVAYGALALLGWASNFILGMGSRLVPGLTAVSGLRPRPLFSPRAQTTTFWCFNAGVLSIVVAAVAGWSRLLTTGIVLALLSTLLFARAVVARVGAMLIAGSTSGHRAGT
ncbi:MAG: hypothetical protein ACE5I7_16295 [Candidatus Binatia bacterium]